VLRAPHRPLPSDEVFRRLVELRDWLRAHPGEAPPQAELARSAGLSRFHFLRRWKEAFGVTPHQDLTRLRIDRAKALLAPEIAGRLATADLSSVTEVCFAVGFSSLGSFSTLFAERAGCPPTAWRRRVWQVAAMPGGHSQLLVPWCFAFHAGAVRE
jgi:AraC-like DNA-binding protein